MANVKTVNDLSEITLVDDGDFLLVWSVSAQTHRKAKKVSLFGSEKDAGFGTISPQASLHVFRPGKVAEVRVESASDDALITLDAHSTHDAYQRFLRSGSQRFVAGYDGQGDAFKMGPATSGGPSDLVNPALMINSSGQVGVGGGPEGQARMTVKAAGRARLLTQTANDTAGSLAEIEASTNGRDVVISVLAHDTLRTNQRFGQTLGGWVEFLAGGGNLAGAILGTLTNTPLILGTNSQERVRIRSGGQVDIHGSVELGSDLNVAGDLDVAGGWGAWNTLTPNSPYWGHADDPSGTTMTLQYRKVGDVVQLRGEAARNSAGNDTITTLPAGFRPPYRIGFYTHSDTNRIYIQTDGRITMSAGMSSVSLNGLWFSVL